MDKTWPCDSPLEDGSRCLQVLNTTLKFCPECGVKAKPPEEKKVAPEYRWPCQQLLGDGSVCGEELASRFKFCPNCGKEVGLPICKHCFTHLEKISKFCSNCGGRLMTAVLPASQRREADIASAGAVSLPPPSRPESVCSNAGPFSMDYAGTGDATHRMQTLNPAATSCSYELINIDTGSSSYTISGSQSLESAGSTSSSFSKQYAGWGDGTLSTEPLKPTPMSHPSEPVKINPNYPPATTGGLQSQGITGNMDVNTWTVVSRGRSGSSLAEQDVQIDPACEVRNEELVPGMDEPDYGDDPGNPKVNTTEEIHTSTTTLKLEQPAESRITMPPDWELPRSSSAAVSVSSDDETDYAMANSSLSLSEEEENNVPDEPRNPLHDDEVTAARDVSITCPSQALPPEDMEVEMADMPLQDGDDFSNRNIFSGGNIPRSGVDVKYPTVFGTCSTGGGRESAPKAHTASLPDNAQKMQESKLYSSCHEERESPDTTQLKQMGNQISEPWPNVQRSGRVPTDLATQTSQEEKEIYIPTCEKICKIECERQQQSAPIAEHPVQQATQIPIFGKASEVECRLHENTPTHSKPSGITPQEEASPDSKFTDTRDELRRKRLDFFVGNQNSQDPLTGGGDAHNSSDLPSQDKTQSEEVPPCKLSSYQTTYTSSTKKGNLNMTDSATKVQTSCEAQNKTQITQDSTCSLSSKQTTDSSDTITKTDTTTKVQTPPGTCVAESTAQGVASVENSQPEESLSPDTYEVSSQEHSKGDNSEDKTSKLKDAATDPLQSEAGLSDAEIPNKPKESSPETKQLSEGIKNYTEEGRGQPDGQPPGNSQGNVPANTEKAYNKMESEPPVYVTGKNKKKKGNATNKATHEKDHEKMIIHFHVIVEAEFKYDRKAAKVYIMFGDDRIGGWKRKMHEMHCVRELEDNSFLMSVDVAIPVFLLSRSSSSIWYKYALVRDGSEKWYWESVKGPTNPHNGNRRLDIPSSNICTTDSIHKYDGVMLRQPEDGVFSRVGKYIMGTKAKTCRHFTLLALQEMLPSWDGFCCNGKMDALGSTLTANDVLDRISYLRESINSWPLCSDFTISDRDEIFKEALRKYIQAGPIFMRESDERKEETPDEASVRMASAMTSVVLTGTYKLVPGVKAWRNTMGALQIQPDVKQKMCHDYSELIGRLFPKKERFLANHLKKFIQNHVENHRDDFRWLKCVPLLHFLQGRSKPFEVPGIIYSRGHRHEAWWGIEDISQPVNALQNNGFFNEDTLKHVLTSLEQLFTVDWLLPRTILACLKPGHIKTVVNMGIMPQEAVLAMAWYHIHCGGIHPVSIKENIPLLLHVATTLSNEKDTGLGKEHAVILCEIAFGISLEIFDLITHLSLDAQSLVREESVIQMIYVLLQTFHARREIIKTSKPTELKQIHGQELQFIQTAIERVVQWLYTWLPQSMVRSHGYSTRPTITMELKVWSDLLSIQFPDKESDLLWKTCILNKLKERLTEMRNAHVLEVYSYHVQFDTHCPALVECFNEHAFDAADYEIMQGGGILDRGETLHIKVLNIFTHAFLKKWPKTDERSESDAVLRHILTLPSFKRFLCLFTNKAVSPKLGEDCQSLLAKAMSLLHTLVRDIASGDIRVSQMCCILENPQALIENAEAAGACESTEVPSAKVLQDTIEWRKRELEVVDECKRKAINLLSLCKNDIGSVDTSELEMKVEKANMDLNLNALCDCVKYNPETKEFDKDTPQVTLFGFSKEVEGRLNDLLELHKSELFTKILKSSGKSCLNIQQQGSLTINHVFYDIFNLTMKSWHTWCKNVQEGSVQLKSVDFGFKQYYSREEKLEEELRYMFDKEDDPRIQERLSQIKRFSTLTQYEGGARVILYARNQLKLQGNFGSLEQILQATKQSTTELRSITEKMVRAGESLKGMTNENIRCLETYLRCGPLVAWLREHIKRVQELKGFVDLALISATGKGDMEVTKVSCLHAAVSGFAPLIYDLEEKAGFEEFYKKCEDVWQACSADNKLPNKLSDLNDELEWLKGVNDAQGDVEVNALKQVAAINSRGIYIVGRASQKQSISAEDVIRVRIPPEEKDKGKAKLQEYSLADLKELQSKLMLVAGKAEKGNEDVDAFVEKFDGITGLANTFVSICTAGNILFKTWTAKFYCDTSRPVNAVVDFGLSEQKLSGSDVNVTSQINQVRQFIESCLDEWKEYIEQERAKYSELNHYTTEQLVILRSQLARLTTGREAVDDKVLTLLQDVRADCTMRELQTAYKNALQELKNQGVPAEDEEKPMSGTEDSDSEEEEGRTLKSLEKTYGPRIVALAQRQYPDLEIDELELKCMDIEEMYQEHPMELELEDEPENLTLESLQTEQTMKEIAGQYLQQVSTQKSNLRDKLESLWKNVHSCSTKSMSDYLSMEHLGMILRHLSNAAPDPRPLPPYMHESQPNLIVCHESDILATVVSVYMEKEDLPLPSRNEVLLCNEVTTPEQVELLVRRAVSNKAGQIFMAVSVHLLNYEVAAHLERSIEKHTQGQTEYRFVVVCSSEQQDRSQLVTALDNFRVHTPARPSLDRLRAYLQKHLQKKGTTLSACDVDPEQCCVRVVRSDRAGTGKTLWMKTKSETLKNKIKQQRVVERCQTVSLPLFGRVANMPRVLNMLMEYTPSQNQHIPSIYHINIPHEMQDGVDHLLFNLVVLGSLVDPVGYAWRRNSQDLYIIEIVPLLKWECGTSDSREEGEQSVHYCLELLPTVTCRSPLQSMQVLQNQGQARPVEWSAHDQLMDMDEFIPFQRVYQYLSRHQADGDLRQVDPHISEGTPAECLHILLRYCGLQDPSWAELVHFVRFLNVQLSACERSSFCTIAATSDDTLPGFLKFVVRFMIQMSKDFSTRSLNIAEETNRPIAGAAAGQPENEDMEEELLQFQLKRRWETSPHPYIFFNPDHETMTFLGFSVSEPNYDIVDAQTNTVLEERIMNKELFGGLRHNKVDLKENFNQLPRNEKIKKLCMVMGNDTPHDPDENYVLTADNVKKLLAIQMRFRCNIPVVIMGETGCGKTELIKFMCRLQCPPGKPIKNMLLMKVHGGTTEEDLIRKVREGQELAQHNQNIKPDIHTVLFLDEVNTTEALGLVKEILCDHTLNGGELRAGSSLRLIAACNPYRKHSQEVIDKLEQAGLGYHVKAAQTADKLGRIPMRRLVYRVQPLPQSLLPLVWDFGQLPPHVEQLYIQQIVKKKLSTGAFGIVSVTAANTITNILVAAQNFMREQQDECSFVSLRDVKRTMDVMAWFYSQRGTLFEMMDTHRQQEADADTTGLLGRPEREEDEESDSDSEEANQAPTEIARSLILALGVCYHACLQEKREEFREHVSELFEDEFELMNGPVTIEQEISLCQDVVLNSIQLEENIARNQALKENVFMMVVCIELRIPLFLVGKPGSSKSLAKTIVMDAMQGPNSHSKLFKNLKQAYMVSYQCSPLSTPDGIVSIFGQCAQLQKDKGDLNKFVAVVVLDEIGLAEDSPRMPLKTLHPLLEDGCEGDDEGEVDHKKVGFIGISNWALDPAKMNRGIMVQRGPPDVDELEQTATEICSSDATILKHITPLMKPLADAYTVLYNKACDIREFFGLRDFYSLVKMVHGFAKRSRKMPTWYELQHAILRNFGGLDSVEPEKVFTIHIRGLVKKGAPKRSDPNNSPGGLIRASLCGNTFESESRYLLVLTENYAALQILQQDLDAMRNAIIIFGSSFPKDQDYVVVCRNINRIKVCMETGQTVVLLNLESLYESLYDALNQYYTYFGGQRHVDLGLGSHRVKSRVHQDFKLIVVAEKDVVYEKFPIPLINRLEKHFVAKSTMLSGQQQRIVERLTNWTKNLARVPVAFTMSRRTAQPTAGDIFIGYHHDTCATVVLQVCYQMGSEGDEVWAEEVFQRSKEILLQCATPEAIVRAQKSQRQADEEDLMDVYFKQQQHDSLIGYLQEQVGKAGNDSLFIQVTTHSRLLSNKDVSDVAQAVGLPNAAVNSQALHAFNTEQQFYQVLRGYFNTRSTTDQILIIQCDSGDKSGELIACARYMIREEFHQAQLALNETAGESRTKRHILIIVQLPRVSGGCFIGFQGGMWLSVHLDDLRAQTQQMPPVAALKNKSVSSLVQASLATNLVTDSTTPREETDMEVDVDVGDLLMEHDLDGDQQTYGMAESRFDYHQLLRSCIHGAAAMLKDRVDVGKSTARVHKLLSLVPETPEEAEQEDQLTFSNVLKERVYLLLKEKEEQKMLGTMANDWLINEVASVDAINKAGTFRRSLWDYLELKVTPILAGLVAFVDTNNNLSLIGDQMLQTWKEKMWLNLFKEPKLTDFAYDDLISAKRGTELQEMTVQMRGVNGTVMSGQLPFSWLLKNYIDDLVNQKQKEKVGKKDVSRTVGHMLKQSPWWPILEYAFLDAGTVTVQDCYMDDLVCMVYKPQTEDTVTEYKLVKRAISTALVQLQEQQQPTPEQPEDAEAGDEEEELGVEHLLPMIHIAESAIHSRIQLFSEVIMQHPETVGHVEEFLEKETKHPLSSDREMALDVLSVKFVVENIQPNHKLLRKMEDSRKWLHQVEMASPLVNTILARARNFTATGVGSYSGDCIRVLQEIWGDWNRVSAVKLFVEMVCPEGSDQEKLITKFGPMLFTKLNKADFKTQETMKKVEEFLRLVTKTVAEKYVKNVQMCPSCNEALMVSIVLPCKHEICEMCIQQLQEADDFSCFQCKKAYEPTLNLKTQEKSREQTKKFRTFKQRCNSFLTELVSRMCFVGKKPPEDGVVKMLMGYITKQQPTTRNLRRANTKAMNLFNDNLDPTPVVRSVLLQLLLRSSIDEVHEHLYRYFENAKDHVTDEKDLVDLAVLYVQCLEDHYYNSAPSASDTDISVVGFATKLLKECSKELNSDTVTQLSAIAKARFGLSVVADWLIKVFIKKQTPTDTAKIDSLFRVARGVCTKEEHPGLGIFLIRQLVRRYSLNELLQITAAVPWVIPDHAKPDEADAAPDYFVIWGDGYTSVRNALNHALVDDDLQPLNDRIEGQTEEDPTVQHMLLAVFREVTHTYIHGDAQKRPPAEAIERIQTTLDVVPGMENYRDMLHALLTNKLGRQCPRLTVSPNVNNVHLSLVEVVVHFMAVVNKFGDKNNILRPIINLITDPASMQGAFLPTMPEDVRVQVHQALLDARTNAGNDPNPFFYECPNGHIYVIGNCGRPVTTARCFQCGELIGGAQYRLADRNREAQVRDTTQPGHSLGPPGNRSFVPAPERSMTPACTALVRLLVHLSLYVGANGQQQGVQTLITPAVQQAEVPGFIWQHIRADMEVLSRATGKGMDDVFLLVHLFIQHISTTCDGTRCQDPRLSTKQSRGAWETDFANRCVMPLLNNLDTTLRTANQAITNDDRQTNNVLRRLVHESEAPIENMDVREHLEQAPALWRYRTRVSIEHLMQELGEKTAGQARQDQDHLEKYRVLSLFLTKEPLLRVVRYIPRILRLVTILTQRYHRRIDRTEADDLMVKNFLDEIRQADMRERCEALFDDFATAWTAVHTNLQTHVVLGRVLPAEYCNQTITRETRLSTFLPSVRDRGLCVISLLHYLATVQNEFMAEYCQTTKTPPRPEVSFADLTPAHLINYDPDRDLLPMVVANCTYSLEVGHGTKIEYNFRSLEQQLQERLIKGKAMLLFQLEPLSYREDLNNAALFKSLEKKIPQSPLSLAVRDKIRGDCHFMMEISDCLASLDITIGFLVSVGGDPDTRLSDFMSKTLQMDAGSMTQMARQHAKLCHSRALWLLFSHEREKLAAKYKQEPFTSVDTREYRVELSPADKRALEQALSHVDIDRFLTELHECIVLHLTVRTDPNDEDYVDNKKHKLSDEMAAYMESKDVTPPQALYDGTFPPDILVEQCVEVWGVAFNFSQNNATTTRHL